MPPQEMTGHGPSWEALERAVPSFGAAVDDDPATQLLNADAVFEAEAPLAERRWDWGDHMTLPHPRSQGSWNACVSFAAVAMIEARRRLVLHDQTRFIPGHIHNCSLGLTDPASPSNPTQVLDVCTARGVAVGQNDFMPVSTAVCAATNLVKIAGWNWVTGPNTILNQLVSDGPMIVTMWVDRSFFNDRDAQVYVLPSGSPQTLLHAVLLVGYDMDQGWALVLNSAGGDWGINGIGRVRLGSGGLVTSRSGAAGRIA